MLNRALALLLLLPCRWARVGEDRLRDVREILTQPAESRFMHNKSERDLFRNFSNQITKTQPETRNKRVDLKAISSAIRDIVSNIGVEDTALLAAIERQVGRDYPQVQIAVAVADIIQQSIRISLNIR